jgi:tRNA-2-methylthio-N6-dimethylallyladenosine synthase
VKSSKAKTFWIETWGCQMNELDTQRMAGQLMQSGMLPTRNVEDADIILLNSCSVREKAEHKVFSQLGRYRRFKADHPELLIGLCGCVAQQVGETALDRNPDLDFVLGPARVGELSRILARRQPGERIVATGFPEERQFDIDSISRVGTYKGMVTVIEGCDKNCTFCIVPLTRGPERCRPIEEIVSEVEHLVDYGFLEIELLGQTVNHWRQPGGHWDFADLLDRVAGIPGVQRLRFVTSYPRDFSPRMVEQFARHTNICPYLHLPVQSGSDRILKRMGRGYTVGAFKDLVGQLRQARPDLALSTDLIVGFPGETEGDFEQTRLLLEETGFASIYAFKYSPRPGTAAVQLPDPVDDSVASRRLQELLQVQESIQRSLNEQLVGSEMDVLVTGWSEQPQLQSGRTSCHRIVHFPAEPAAHPLGSIAPIVIEKANPHSLLGRQAELP